MVKVHLLSQSHPIVYNESENCYVKDGYFCVLVNGIVHKYPSCNIFRVEEDYRKTQIQNES